MHSEVFEVDVSSLSYSVGSRCFGQQDRGVGPGGAADQLSFLTAQVLLGQPQFYQCHEIHYCREVRFSEDCLFIVTGAPLDRLEQKNLLQLQSIEQNRVCMAQTGDRLLLGNRRLGQWFYLTAVPLAMADRSRAGLRRGEFSQWFSFCKKVRVMPGPEFDTLKSPEVSFSGPWRIDHRSDRMGLRLKGPKLLASRYDIISSAVTDGTIQLTASGPIVLMRQRQTTGGYPRILQCALSDLDTLAQMTTSLALRFELITMQKAQELAQERQRQIDCFKAYFE